MWPVPQGSLAGTLMQREGISLGACIPSVWYAMHFANAVTPGVVEQVSGSLRMLVVKKGGDPKGCCIPSNLVRYASW